MESNEPFEPAPVPPWWRRGGPVSLAVLVLATLAFGLVPPLREQLLLSASHRPASYVELAFTPDHTGLVHPCARSGRGAAVRFSLVAHGAAAGTHGWRIRLVDPSGRRPDRTMQDESALIEDRPVAVRRVMRTWDGPYDVVVSLTGTSQRLVAHCGEDS